MLISSSFIYCVWVVLLFSSEIVADKNAYQKSESSQIVHDVPSPKDLRVYLSALDRVINFSNNHFKDYSDVSYLFALFLVNVNLKPFVSDESLMSSLRSYLKSILDITDKIIDIFYVKGDRDLQVMQSLLNVTFWTKRLKKYRFELPQKWGLKTDRYQVFPDWKTYISHVDDYGERKPIRELSDLCLDSLVDEKKNNFEYLQKCKGVPKNCYKMLLAGPDFGYGLTHRLLFLQAANFGRGCNVLSTEQDHALMRRFCNFMHIEAEFNAYNRYRHPDLMFELIALCSLNGHAEFLVQTWMTNLLRFQTPHGCFSMRRPAFRRPTFRPYLRNFIPQEQNTEESDEEDPGHDLMNKTCSSHVTAVAAAAIAAAVRFILEQYLVQSD